MRVQHLQDFASVYPTGRIERSNSASVYPTTRVEPRCLRSRAAWARPGEVAGRRATALLVDYPLPVGAASEGRPQAFAVSSAGPRPLTSHARVLASVCAHSARRGP